MAQIMKKTMVKKDNGNIFVKSEYNTLFVKKHAFWADHGIGSPRHGLSLIPEKA